MFALIAAVLFFIMAFLNVVYDHIEASLSSVIFTLALGFWALHFAVPIPLVRKHPPQ